MLCLGAAGLGSLFGWSGLHALAAVPRLQCQWWDPLGVLYGVGAYLLGEEIHRVAGPVGISLGIVAGVVIVVYLVFVWRNEKRLEDEAERALPGPLDHARRTQATRSAAKSDP